MTHASKISSVALLLAVGLSAAADAGGLKPHCQTHGIRSTAPRTSHVISTPRVVYKRVQPTPEYAVQRPEVVSGTRLTLFANFLQNEQGYVFLDFNGTTAQCQIHNWSPNSVTFDLPKLGLGRNVAAKIRVVLPNGRVAKSVAVVLIPQPTIVVHEETIPQPMPPAANASGSGVYAGSAEVSFAE